MSTIEWNESSEFEPQVGSIVQFCEQNGISMSEVQNKDELQIFILKNALESLHEFLAHDPNREHGGVLVGKPFVDREIGKNYVVIKWAVPGLETEGSSVHLQFTPETWDYISNTIEGNYPDHIVVGWYHSHPGLGVFMSGTDRATQRAFYSHPWNVAIVADPIAKQTGWFAGPECVPLAKQQVISFVSVQPVSIVPESIEPEVLSREYEYWKMRTTPDWRWLLPFGFLIVGSLALTWWLNKDRLMPWKD